MTSTQPRPVQTTEPSIPVALPILVEKIHYQVKHWLPGRFRLYVPQVAYDESYRVRLEHGLTQVMGVQGVRVNPEARAVVVDYEPDLPVNQVQEAIFAVIQNPPMQVRASRPVTHEVNYQERLGLPILSLGLSLALMVGLPLPEILLAGLIFVAALPVFQRAWAGIREEHQLNIDFLDALALSAHVFQGNYFASTFMMNLIEGGEVIRDMTARGTDRASLDLLDCLNQTVRVERDGQEVDISVRAVVPGDRVLVYPGDQIPVDGYLLRGTLVVDQCKLTGESVPVRRETGDEVFASTLVVDGTACILTERTGNETRAGIIVSLMEAAPVHDTRVENYAALVANQAVVPTLLIGGAVWGWTGDAQRAIALITLDFGTGIRVSVPTAILSALTYAARNGVFIRSGRAIEMLARVDAVVFDKTGTLTQGQATVTEVRLVPGCGETVAGVLALAATAEQGLTHPVAEAIVRHARQRGIEPGRCDRWEYRVGMGVVAEIQEREVLVGSHRLMAHAGVAVQGFEQAYPDLKTGSYSPVYVAAEGMLLGVILYRDPLRSESAGVIEELQQLRVTPYMLSGDVKRVAYAVANEVGIAPERVYGEAFPERKVEVVKAIHDQGRVVAFCGDGINDSAALAYADASISFGGATDIARETADVVLMENDLRGLTQAIKVARYTMEVIWQNTLIVAVPNLGALLAGIFFALDPILAIVINNGSAILAELNGLRPLLGPGEALPILQGHLDQEALMIEEDHLHHRQELQGYGSTHQS
ncbi:MAG: heavy metal translocating P-type ATPase [Gloeomargarita sp. DG_1_6_bins_138]